MKRKSLQKSALKRAVLAVPAAALMLGAAQAGTTVGMNFMAWYYDSGTTPQTIGFGSGYQTTGWPVTAMAFGVPATSWYGTSSPDLLDAYYVAINNTYAFGPTTNLNATLTAPGVWQSGIGELVHGFHPEQVTPGNDEVTWNYLFSDASSSPSVTITGLATQFPNGYAVQTIAAHSGVVNFNGVTFTDGATANDVPYATTYYEANPQSDGYVSGGTIGLSAPSGTFKSDTLFINCDPEAGGSNSVLSAFIITDQPVVTRSVPASLLILGGNPINLPAASIVGIGLSYQWQLNGVPIPNAVGPTYSKAAAGMADSGTYQVVATSSYFPGQSVTGVVAQVSVVPLHPPQTSTFDANLTATGAQDGSGTWAYAVTNWWNGSRDDYWNPTDSAVFGLNGAGAYTVTLGDNLTAAQITFNTGGYTVTNSGSQTLTLAGTGGITANRNATISAPLTVAVPTNSFIKSGTAYLRLIGAFTCPSNTVVAAGTLEILKRTGGDAPFVVTNGATLKLGYSTGGGYANTGMQLYGDGVAATSGLYLAGGTIYNVSGTLNLLGAPTTIRQYGTGPAGLGIFDINSTGLHCSAAASGSVIATNIQMVNDGYGMAGQVDAGANTATGDLVLNGPLGVDARQGVYGFVKRGTGSLRLNAPASDANSGLQVRAGSAICGVVNCIGTNATLATSAGATIDLNGYSQTVSNANLAGNIKMAINKGGPVPAILSSVGNPLTLGGSLTVTNLGGALAIGDTFTLFTSAAGFSGNFSALNLPLQDGLAWQDNTAVDGTIQVIAGSVPPSLVTDLSGSTTYAFVGGSATFTVAATGDPLLHYRWKFNGTTPVGTDSPTLKLTGLTTGAAGFYSVTVTNRYGVAQSQTNYLLVTVPGAYVAAVLQDGPLDFWPLNEVNSTVAYDYAAGNNGDLNGSFTLGAAGPSSPADAGFPAGNVAYQFDGGSAFIDLGPGPALSGTTDFTLEAWIKPNSPAKAMIIQQRYLSGFNGEYQFAVNADGTLAFTVYGGGGYQFNFSSGNVASPVTDGNWHHVAAVRSGANGYLYADGTLVGSASGNPAPLDPSFRVYIGVDGRDMNSYYGGYMADVAIYGRALTAAQVANHANIGINGVPPTLSLVGNTLVWPAGTLVSSPVLGPGAVWTPVSGAASPYLLPTLTQASQTLYYRVRR